jgi:hypothetical protein
MFVKIIIVILFLFILGSLASAMFHLMRSDGSGNGTVRALTYRIVLSLIAFLFLLASAKLGWIEPTGF